MTIRILSPRFIDSVRSRLLRGPAVTFTKTDLGLFSAKYLPSWWAAVQNASGVRSAEDRPLMKFADTGSAYRNYACHRAPALAAVGRRWPGDRAAG